MWWYSFGYAWKLKFGPKFRWQTVFKRNFPSTYSLYSAISGHESSFAFGLNSLQSARCIRCLLIDSNVFNKCLFESFFCSKSSIIFFYTIEIMSILNTMISGTETPFPAWLGPKLVVFVDKPEDVQIIFSQKSFMEKSAFYRLFDRKSMLTAPGKFN